MLALGIYDKLTPGDLVGHAHIAGTGTIDPSGAVGAIGGATLQQRVPVRTLSFLFAALLVAIAIQMLVQ